MVDLAQFKRSTFKLDRYLISRLCDMKASQDVKQLTDEKYCTGMLLTDRHRARKGRTTIFLQ